MSPNGPARTPPRWWLPTVAALAAGLSTAAFMMVLELGAPHPPEGRSSRPEPLGASDGAIHLAGTGSWLPLARSLARAFSAHPGAPPVVVHQSIGSGGGRRALHDGVIDIALVSSAGGPPRIPRGCRALAVAKTAVVFAAHPLVPQREITSPEVVEIFSGRRRTWPDGSVVVPLLRERGDSATEIAAARIAGLGPTIERARRGGRWPLLLTDAQMTRALLETPGGIGIHDLGEIRLESPSVRVLALDGVTPSPQNVANGRYPLVRTLLMLYREPPSPNIMRLLDFVRSEAGRQVVARSDAYLPMLGDDE